MLVDAPATELPGLANALRPRGIHVSFALDQAPSTADASVLDYGDQAMPLLPRGRPRPLAADPRHCCTA